MRKEVILILLVLLIPQVIALSVSLNSPSTGNTTNMTSIIFSCATSDTYSISSITLYMNTSSNPWVAVTSQSNASTTANFLVSSLTQGSYIWNCLALNSNNENISASSNYSLTISTLAFSGSIANYSVTEDLNSSNLFDLDSYFTGANYYTFSGNSSSIIVIDSNNQLSISPSANFTGSQNITIRGLYGSNTVSSNEFLINVTNVNDAPLKTANISDLTLEKNANTTLSMSSYFSDIDPLSNLTYTLSASNINLVQNGNTVTVVPSTDWEGKVNASISASDGSASVVSNTFSISVGSTTASSESTNTAPAIDSYSPESDPSIEVGETQDFSITSSDAEDTVSIKWYVNDVEQSSTSESFSYIATEEGVFTVKVVVSDGSSDTSKSWTLTVGSEIVSSEIEVESILSESTTSSICGNKIVEAEENCSSCALDVACNSDEVCNNGTCEKKKSALKAILIFAIISIVILVLAIFIYYITSLKSTGRKQNNTTFQYTPVGAAPPADYTDFYKGKK